MLANCFRFAPRDSVPGLIAKICKYLKDHPGWSEEELEEHIRQLVGQTGVASFNGRTGDVLLTDNDVNNLKISSAYFAEGNETIDELNLVELYKHGIRFVFTNWNSVTSGYDKSFVLDYFSGSGNVVYYPIASVSVGSSESPVVSVNSMVGAVTIPVVDVSEYDSNNQFAKIFINESEDYPIAPSYDSDRLGGKQPSYYASSESVTEIYNGLAPVAKSGSYNDLKNKPIIPIVPMSLPNPNKLIMTGAVTAEYDGSSEVSVDIPSAGGEAWQLIASSDTEVTASLFEINADNDGNSFSLKKAILYAWISTHGAYSYVNLGIQKFNWLVSIQNNLDMCMYRVEFKKDVDEKWMCEANKAKYDPKTYIPTENYSVAIGKRGNTIKDTITSVFLENGDYTTISKYALYGIRE